jgi:hypothetical protein
VEGTSDVKLTRSRYFISCLVPDYWILPEAGVLGVDKIVKESGEIKPNQGGA